MKDTIITTAYEPMRYTVIGTYEGDDVIAHVLGTPDEAWDKATALYCAPGKPERKPDGHAVGNCLAVLPGWLTAGFGDRPILAEPETDLSWLASTALPMLEGGCSIEQVRTALRESTTTAGDSPTCGAVEEAIQTALQVRNRRIVTAALHLSRSVPVERLVNCAQRLKSEDAENGEYDRALVELVCDSVGLSMELAPLVSDQLEIKLRG